MDKETGGINKIASKYLMMAAGSARRPNCQPWLWLAIRPSNTEPLLRLNVEAKNSSPAGDETVAKAASQLNHQTVANWYTTRDENFGYRRGWFIGSNFVHYIYRERPDYSTDPDLTPKSQPMVGRWPIHIYRREAICGWSSCRQSSQECRCCSALCSRFTYHNSPAFSHLLRQIVETLLASRQTQNASPYRTDEAYGRFRAKSIQINSKRQLHTIPSSPYSSTKASSDFLLVKAWYDSPGSGQLSIKLFK